ncbi:exosome complex RNA-binding protein Csl4 [Geoglobus acetivorans]
MFVLPGDFLGYAEEYMPGKGVYEEDGKLFAATAGKVRIEEKTISVETVKEIPELGKDDVVIGRVVDTRNSFAMVEIARKRGSERALRHYDRALLHISNMSKDYMKNVDDAVKYWDIVVARVIDNSLRLSIKEKDLGVVRAICSKCGSRLEVEKDKLKCPECGNVEKRKVSANYGKGEW